MIQNIYVVKDALTTRTDLFMEENDPAAMRSFRVAINTDIKKAMNAGNYDLYRIGTYDNEKIAINVLKTPEMVCRGVSVLEGVKNDVPDNV